MRLTKPTHGHSKPAPQIGFGVTRHFENTVDWAVGRNRLRDGGKGGRGIRVAVIHPYMVDEHMLTEMATCTAHHRGYNYTEIDFATF